MTSKTKARGQITYDNYFGHVCSCTAKQTTVSFAGFEGEQGAHDWTTYENTVECDRSSGTESGSFAYYCTRCGATAWSGL